MAKVLPWQLQILETGDLARFRATFAKMSPHLPQPKNDEQAAIMLHHVRTQADNLGFKLRAYSHRWLTERSIPSGLPDELKPRAERMYPKIVTAVGISVHSKYPVVRDAIRGAMETAVQECYAEGVTDPKIVSAQMQAARAREQRGLMGG